MQCDAYDLRGSRKLIPTRTELGLISVLTSRLKSLRRLPNVSRISFTLYTLYSQRQRCGEEPLRASLLLPPPLLLPRARLVTQSGESRFNKYISIAARATRQALKEEERVAAQKRNEVSLKVQDWKGGKSQGPQVRLRFLLDFSSGSLWGDREDGRADMSALSRLGSYRRQRAIKLPINELSKELN
jgi:F-type H+-transporting ATPase subunit epsilon